MRGLKSIGMLKNPMNLIKEHSHNSWEIIYYTYGTGVNILGGEKYPIEPGVILCQPPGIPHCEQSEGGFMNIHFPISHMNDLGTAVPYFKDTANQDFYKVLWQMYLEFHARRSNYIRITEGLLAVLYEYLLSFQNQSRKNKYVESFEEILISNISSAGFEIGNAMQKIPMNMDHFRRLFVKETGKTPVQYLTELRISHAKQLLESNHSIIKNVAYLSGFDDPYYFSRVFRKVTGTCPNEWKGM